MNLNFIIRTPKEELNKTPYSEEAIKILAKSEITRADYQNRKPTVREQRISRT